METTVALTADQEIEHFVQASYTPEHATTLKNAIALLYVFEVEGVQDTLCEMLYSPEADDIEAFHSAFSNRVFLFAQDLITNHGVTLNEPSLRLCVEVMAALYRIQRVEDPDPYLRLLEVNTLDNQQKLAAIISNVCSLSELELMEVLDEVDDSLHSQMSNYLTQLSQQNVAESDPQDKETEQRIVSNFKHFVGKFGTENLGYEVMASGMLIGMPSTIYLAYFEDHLKTSDPATKALDLLSLFFLAEDTWLRPIEAYRTISERIVTTPADLPKVEKRMQELYELFKQYIEVKDGAAAVPPVQHQA